MAPKNQYAIENFTYLVKCILWDGHPRPSEKVRTQKLPKSPKIERTGRDACSTRVFQPDLTLRIRVVFV
ncbi:hypothetical protein CAL7102_04326 [Dulcicalothrix desertica PCC 7102]|nr:hypothetical protein CAL7102_04326 [Dulcicalothrix desertica PCC 7102]